MLSESEKLDLARKHGLTDKQARYISGDTAVDFEADVLAFVDDLSPEQRAVLDERASTYSPALSGASND